jgi:uncharacterized protein (TIGR02444 family)
VDIWSWAQRSYAQPGVAAACLRLQDDFDQDIPYLLWAVWAGVTEPGLLGRGARLARDWERGVTSPLRTARRALKTPPAGLETSGCNALRDQVKAAELEAERLLLQALADLTDARAGALPQAALDAAVQTWGAPAHPLAVADLARALG